MFYAPTARWRDMAGQVDKQGEQVLDKLREVS